MYPTPPLAALPALPPDQFEFKQVGNGPIGEGGLGRVHKIVVVASNSLTHPIGSYWATKTLNDKWRAHPGMQQRFEREISALERMSHPNIVKCMGQNLPGGERFYVMPFFSNNLRHFISKGGYRGDWRKVATFGAELARALQYAHSQGFVHRDLKPDNILFNDGGPLVIADWGLGYFIHKHSVVLQQLTRGGMGTEYYCSREQWATGKCDARGDIYSLGMTLDEWITGHQRSVGVGSGLTGDATADTSPAARRFNALLRQMTLVASAQRPGSMSAVANELTSIANSP